MIRQLIAIILFAIPRVTPRYVENVREMKTILEKWIKIAETIASYWLQQVTDSRNQELVAQGVIAQYTADVSHAGLLPARAAYQQLRGVAVLRAHLCQDRRNHHHALCRSGRVYSPGDLARRGHSDRRAGDASSTAGL